MKKPIIAGNWKMFKITSETESFINSLKGMVGDVSDREIVICPTFTSLHVASKLIQGSNLKLGAQNVFWEQEGAFTGEISGPMLKDAGCTFVIIGHSERRQYFKEKDKEVNKKIHAALQHNLTPIVCIGEKLEEREKNKTFEVIGKQFKGAFRKVKKAQMPNIVIAYEPVWAIGTGKTATPQQAEEVHAFIRKLLADKYKKEIAQQVRILYGGSVKPENISELMAKPNIDGALVGGASLKPDSFEKIIKY